MQVAHHQSIPQIPKALLTSQQIGALGAFFEPTPGVESDLTSKQERLINELVSVLDKQLLHVVGSRTEKEFCDRRQAVWQKYIRAVRALHDTVTNLIDDTQIEVLLAEARPIITADLQKQERRFGSAVTEQALFTLWIVEKFRPLAEKIDILPVPEGKRRADKNLFNEYYTDCLWSQFHLDVLIAAIKFDRPIAAEITESMLDGLRNAVDAYAIMREALRLRQSVAVTEGAVAETTLPWDEEDEKLLAASMRDMRHVRPD